MIIGRQMINLNYINTTMRSIRKLQNDCSLLHMCSTDSSILNRNGMVMYLTR